MGSVAACKRIAVLAAELGGLLAEPMDGSASERAAAAFEWETFTRRCAAMDHRVVASLAEVPAEELGASSVADALSTLLRISSTEANRRVKDAKDLGPRTAMTGEPLEPMLSNTAAAQCRGQIGFEHVKIIRRFFTKLPHFVAYDTREAAEAQLAELACGLRPEDLRAAADRLAFLLDQDGELSDADRAKRSYFTKAKQGRDGQSEVRGCVDPELAGLLDAVFAKWAAPGMCNPAEDTPCVDGEASDEQRRSDTRSAGQRQHDALKAICRAILASGQLGSHKGLPVTLVISTTLKELESGTGHAVTGGGTLLPMAEVIKQAAAAHHYLVVFDDHTEEPLYLGRAKRLASRGQRIVLYARDRGCTRPGCTAPAYWCEAHHDDGWAAGQAPTDITKMSLACPVDNKRIEKTGWRTRKRKDGRTQWIPPPNLDTGQTRINNYHHPERYLIPDESDSDNDGNGDDEVGEES
jgi:hypothetical protein